MAMQQIRRPPPLEKGVKQGLVSMRRVKAELKYPHTPIIPEQRKDHSNQM